MLKATADLPEDGGNALILDDTISIELTWKSETLLVVSGLADAHVFKSEAEAEGVHLSYVK